MDIIRAFVNADDGSDGSVSCKVATSHDIVLNSECCYTFFTPYHHDDEKHESGSGGILVNLSTFLGTIPELAVIATEGAHATTGTKGSTDKTKSDALDDNHNNSLQLFVRIRKKQIAKASQESQNTKEEQPSERNDKVVSKLAIGVDGGFPSSSDKFETLCMYSVVLLDGTDGTIMAEVPYSDETKCEFPDAVCRSVESIVHHAGILTQQQIDETWQDEPVPVSKFANDALPFVDNGVTISPNPADWKCEASGATDNLWLNLSDGYIGGGRKHWDGSGGSNGAIDHYYATGQQYPLVVKLGTISPDDIDSADCYSYDPSEDGPVKVPNLAEILHRRGIVVGALSKTTKSTAELEIHLNATYAFDAITEAGSELEPISGPTFQGLQNLGNSCYMNSVVQCLFSLPEFAKRYGLVHDHHTTSKPSSAISISDIPASSATAWTNPTITKQQLLQRHPYFGHHFRDNDDLSSTADVFIPASPTTDVICQTIKLASALTSGIYSKPTTPAENIDNTITTNAALTTSTSANLNEDEALNPKYRIAPRMFKHCIGKDHQDFKTSQQQDAAQYFQYMIQKLDQAELSLSRKYSNEIKDWLLLSSPDPDLPPELRVSSYLFSYNTTNRLVCSVDGKVKYRTNTAPETILSLRIPMDKATITAADTIDNEANHQESSPCDNSIITSPDQKRLKADDVIDSSTENASSHTTTKDVEKKIVPSVSLLTCLEQWASETTVDGVRWPHLTSLSSPIAPATQTTSFTNFPRYLMIQLQRYALGSDWQPIKLDVNVDVPDEIDLSPFKFKGPQDGEAIVPNDDDGHSDIDANKLNSATTKQKVVFDESALSQLMDMGFSINSCKRALNAVGGSNIEAAMGWIFEHSMDPDFNDPINDDYHQNSEVIHQINDHASNTISDNDNCDEVVVASLVENLGAFTTDQVRFALITCNHAPDRAADYLFSHMDDLDILMETAMQQNKTLKQSDEHPQQQSKATQLPLEDSNNGKYTLIGMISHIGKNTGSGHYVAHLKKLVPEQPKNKTVRSSSLFDTSPRTWVIFNDEKVAISTNPPKKHAYMYLFQRNDTFGQPHPSY